MIKFATAAARACAVTTLAAGILGAASALAAEGPTPAERAIEYRQALYTVIGGNFGPLGGYAQGRVQLDKATIARDAERVAFLAQMVGDAFPEISKDGRTKAKPEIWTNRADFDKKVADLVTATGDLAKTAQQGDEAAIKKAIGATGQTCKSCHDDYRAK